MVAEGTFVLPVRRQRDDGVDGIRDDERPSQSVTVTHHGGAIVGSWRAGQAVISLLAYEIGFNSVILTL